jgi:hypothetical protein
VQSLIDIRNRRDLGDAFQIAMAGAHQSLRTRWQFGKKENLPKSYLIEFHPRQDNHRDGWSTEEVFNALKHSGQFHNTAVQRTEDDSLLFLRHDENANSAEFIVDCLNPRFLIFHTLSNAKATDRFIFRQLTQYQHEFDLFWFPPRLLQDIEQRERVIGWEAVFDPLLEDRGFVSDEEDSEDQEELEDTDEYLESYEETLPPAPQNHTVLRISIRRPNALDSYKLLKSQPDIFSDVPLDSVLAERLDAELDTFARARVKSNGKITGRGSDFMSYLQIVTSTLDNYASVVNAIEERFWIGLEPCIAENSQGLKLRGEPFSIKFNSPFDVKMLVQAMFSCNVPFRLMGTPRRVKDDYYVVDAIDLHVGQPLAFEITPTMMRIYLYQGTCGNSIVRILRSLQHFIDSNLSHPSLQVAA